jgi:hypothetical protein
MKKILALILSLLTVFCFACSKTDASSANTNTTDKMDTDNTKTQPTFVIYSAISLSESDEAKSIADKLKENDGIELTFKPYTEFNGLSIDSSSEYTPTEKNDKKDTTFTLNNKTYEISYARTYNYIRNPQKISILEKIKEYDAYIDNAARYSIYIYSSDNTVKTFLDHTIEKEAAGDLTDQDAENLARNTLKSVYGDDVFERFTGTPELSKGTKGYYFICFKELYGYRTLERVLVAFNAKGEIYQIALSYYGMYDAAAKIYNKETVDQAMNVLCDVLPENAEINDKSLVFDVGGNLCVRITYSIPDAGLGEMVIAL